MEKLLQLASQYADSAEVYHESFESNSVKFENSSLTNINNSIGSAYALRILKNGYVGTSYTNNLHNRQGLIDNALGSLKGKVEGGFSLPEQHKHKKPITYSKSYETLTTEAIIKEQKRICQLLNKRTNGQINVRASFGKRKIMVINTNGLDVENLKSYYYSVPFISYPNTYSSVSELVYSISMSEFPEEKLNKITDIYNDSLNFIQIGGGKISVIFSPDTFFAIESRISSGLNAVSIHQGISPVKEKLGEKIFSEKLTIINDPQLDDFPDSRCFDDEGVPTDKFTLIDKGVVKNFYNSLEFAKKTKMKPTGHGYREAVSTKPIPRLKHLTISTGDITLNEMIAKTERGILLLGCLGAHSGNIPNGDFSIGLSPGIYIENGKIKGRIQDGMIAGNIYDMLNNIRCIENEPHVCSNGRFPAICFDNVNFSVK